MGNVKITSLPKAQEYVRPFAYADLHLDINTQFTASSEFNSINERRDLEVDYDIGAIKNSIVNILTTSPGEKILNPLLGLDLREYLFEPISATTANRISLAIYNGLQNQEPRITFNKIPEIIPDEDQNTYTINMDISVPFLEISRILFVGLLKFDGFTILNNQY